MKRIALLAALSAWVLTASTTVTARAAEYTVSLDEVARRLETASAGDRIVVKNGVYRDLELEWIGRGAEGKPVCIEAETTGGVVIEGASSLRVAGEWLEIAGLVFRNGHAPKGSVVEFRCRSEVADDCRLTACVIDGYNPARRDEANSYVLLYGRRNRVDHCEFTGKLNLGVTLIVMLNEERSLRNFHRIDHNVFGYRPVYGSNGAETIRVGTSHQAYESSNTLIEENLFDRCNGEVEVISIKSSDNIIRNNRFWECEGVLALRHGDRNEAYGNVFVGNGRRNTGGIRVVNAGHRIHDNRFYGLAGGRFFSALALMNAVPNSLPNRYCLVEDVEVRDNLFVDCSNIEFGTGKDLERTLPPRRVQFVGNTIVNRNLEEPYIAVDRTDGIAFAKNRVALQKEGSWEGFVHAKLKIQAAPSYDELRAGCGVTKRAADAVAAPAVATTVVEVAAGEDLPAAAERAAEGSAIVLTTSGGDYALERAVTVGKRLTIRAAEGLEKRPVIRFAGDRSDNMVTIADGGILTIEGIAFSGRPEAGKAMAKAGISTADRMIRPYALTIDGCEFADFGEGGFFAVKGTQSTFAEQVTIRNSLFRNLSGDAINYAAEREDKGRYNADDMLIENCTFERMLGLPINIYRGGSDESTAGPYVTIRGCRFEDCCNKERGSVIRAIGPQVMEISGCTFSNSGRGGASIRLDETTWERIAIFDCTFRNSGRIVSMTGNAVRGGIVTDAPRDAVAGRHPSLLLTARGVEEIRAARGEVPAFDRSLEATLRGADEALALPIVVPQPKDGGGGYTHEQHKLNYYRMFDCGVAYQMTGEEKYARYVIDMLLAYADLYPTLGFHPVKLSNVPGRIFWQTLNESVWLVHTSIAYDCVYDRLTEAERRIVEERLFRPYADFIMNGMEGNRANNEVFNRMHNHGTWATAAVGMIGLAMGDDDLVDRALYGSDKTGRTGGFIRQLDCLFSPDGYFTEGAYYQRYAIWPFVVFAQCIEHNRPEIGIFEYRNGIIPKAVATLTQLAYEGLFLRFNDALEKGYDAQELIYAVDIAYNADPSNKQLLDIAARYQGKFLPTDAGYAVARDIARGEARPLTFRSALYRDGREGDEGGLVAMRSTDPALNSLVTLKATSHGLSHGHYDKLTMAYYDNGNEVLTDYGAARFINIEAKYKGHYTRENKSFAMQTVAHNTLVVDERSHFDGNIKRSSDYHSEVLFADFDCPEVQIASAVERNACEGVTMRRTTAYVTTGFLQYPLILDIVKAESADEHRYDLPYWYNGHMISLNFPYERALRSMTTLGDKNGYQHLWVEAEGRNAQSATSCYTWLVGDRFYSLSTATTPQTELRLVRAGANDPDFNLRGEPAYLIRENGKRNHTFCSALESHGTYDLQVEQSANLTASCRGVELLADTADCTVARFTFEGGRTVVLCVAYGADDAAVHKVVTESGERFEWTGHYDLIL